MKKLTNKYLLLYLNTGAGHVSSAKTIANYIQQQSDIQIEPVLINGFKKTNRLVKYFIEDGYRISQAKAQWAYKALYALNKLKFVAKSSVFAVSLFVKKYLKEVILQHKPAKIIVFHFFLTKAVLDIIHKYKLKTEVITVATDPFTAPKIWFTDKRARYVVFSERAKYQSAMAMGITESNIHVFPFIISHKFNTDTSVFDALCVKRKLNFDTKQKLTLILGGGDGMPRGEKIVKKLLDGNINTQIAIVCGRNIELLKKVNEIKEKYNANNLHIFGFIDFVFELILTSDFVITKGGPSSVMEILLLNKIPILNSYIWGQEKGNMEFVRDNKLGFYEPDIDKLPELIERLSWNNIEVKRINQNIENTMIENGTAAVSKFIMDLHNKKIETPVVTAKNNTAE